MIYSMQEGEFKGDGGNYFDRYTYNGLNSSNEDIISDERVDALAKAAVRLELEKKKALDIPAVVYDSVNGKVYYIAPDGSKTFAGERLRHGRYSEQRMPQA